MAGSRFSDLERETLLALTARALTLVNAERDPGLHVRLSVIVRKLGDRNTVLVARPRQRDEVMAHWKPL